LTDTPDASIITTVNEQRPIGIEVNDSDERAFVRECSVVVMRSCNRNFPGAAPEVSDQFALDVATDEKAIVDAIAALRERRRALKLSDICWEQIQPKYRVI
jgi:citrate lyase gamma subunit